MRFSFMLVCLTTLAVLGGCGRTSLSPNPRGPTATLDGGVDGGECTRDVQCDDGVVCNGREVCLGGSCVSGPPVTCDDGLECTIDQCEEAAAGCTSIPDNRRCPAGLICDPTVGACVMRPCRTDSECDDGVFCNGAEVCLGGTCVGGPPPACGVGDPCLEGRCDFALDECVVAPVDRDDDGHLPRECGGNDCNDKDPRVNPDAPEQCTNGVDDDCNGPTDCADPTCVADPSCGCAPFELSCDNVRDDDCDGLADCGDPDCAGDPICACAPIETSCGDVRDDDCDGLVDCMDPDCGADPTCACTFVETCGNGRDDDCDGATDCMDADCASAPSCMTMCDTRDLGSAVGVRVAMGTTVGRPNALRPSCRPSSTAGEQAFTWRAPRSGTFTIDTFGSSFDTVLYVLASCPGAELPGACNDDTMGLQSRVSITVTAGQSVVIVVDGFGAGVGDYMLSIREGGATEICGDGADNDGDGLVDCADSDCLGAPGCCVPRPEDCSNGVDDDCDTRADCFDFDCRTSPSCCTPRPEICDNFIDDDCDLRRDCGDPDCATAPACCVPAPEDCSNGRDDDCDMLTDCADPGCSTNPVCCVPSVEVCNNGRDDDCDRLVDCADPSCTASPACCVPVPEVCDDGVDQDCDALADCADPDCRAAPACCVPRPEVCDNFADDDCDRRVDCGDPDCATAPACCVPAPEICDDGADQDCDMLVDCADPDCTSAPACRPCPDRDLGSRLGNVASGTTVGAFDDVTPTCARSTAPDVTFRWTAPFGGDFIIDTNGSSYDTMLAILDGCGGPQLACDDDSGAGTQSQIRLRMMGGQSIIIAVDGFGTSSGSFVLNIAGLIGGESNCADGVDNDFDGDIDCADADCAGAPGCPAPAP